MSLLSFAAIACGTAAFSAGSPVAPRLIGQFAASGGGVQLQYSPVGQLLFLRNSASAVRVISATTGNQVGMQLANSAFTDESISPDGEYLYVADYGGTKIGYGTPSGTSYVDRYDVTDNSWQVLAAPAIAYHIKSVDDTHFLLDDADQWVNISLNTFGATSITKTASTVGDYESNLVYDAVTQRVLFGNANESSQEIFADRIVNGSFVAQENSGIYGSAQGYGGTEVLSLNDQYLYYGALQVDALDVQDNIRVFPQQIIAATDDIAFGATSYYDASTGALLGSYGYTAQSIALNPDGTDAWIYGGNELYHYALTLTAVPEPSGFTIGLGASLGLLGRRRRVSA